MKALKLIAVLCFIIHMVAGCSRSSILLQPFQEQDPEHYTSAFPDVNVSYQLEKIHRSLFQISTSNIYKRYHFDDISIAPTSIDTLQLAEAGARVETITKEDNGTAVVVAKNNNTLFLLTSGSIISPPDTVVTRREDNGSEFSQPIREVMVVSNHFNIAIQQPFIGSFEVLIRDNHFALLKVVVPGSLAQKIQPLSIRIGDAGLLKPGSFVYQLGYPKGLAMAERGIISRIDPETGDDVFYTDALFNDGNTGSLIIASKDRFQSFEWVGMTEAPAAVENLLIPEYHSDRPYINFQSYFGPYRYTFRPDFIYGITKVLSSSAVAEFLAGNAQAAIGDSSFHKINPKILAKEGKE